MMVFSSPPRVNAPPFPAVQVANTFIERFGKHGITHLKLQKLVYFAYGWWLALVPTQPRLTIERPQVWKLGPVFQPIYATFAKYRGESIAQMERLGPFSDAHFIQRSEEDHSRIVDWIWSRYGGYSAGDLSDMTHETDTPWFKKAKENNFVVPRFLELDDDEVRAYFYRMGVKEGFIAERERMAS